MTRYINPKLLNKESHEQLYADCAEPLIALVNTFDDKLYELSKQCILTSCCAEHGIEMLTRYLVYSAGQLGHSIRYDTNRARDDYDAGYAAGTASKKEFLLKSGSDATIERPSPCELEYERYDTHYSTWPSYCP